MLYAILWFLVFVNMCGSLTILQVLHVEVVLTDSFCSFCHSPPFQAIHKNSLQLVAFTIFEWCTVSYSGLQIWQHDQLIRDIGVPVKDLVALGDPLTRVLLFLQLAIQIVACLGITLLTCKLYYEFGWLVFQKLGADVSLRSKCFLWICCII